MYRERSSPSTRAGFVHTYGIVCVGSSSCFEAIPDLLFEQGNELLLPSLARPITLYVDLKTLKIIVNSLSSVNISAEICMSKMHFSTKVAYVCRDSMLSWMFIICNLKENLHIPEK